MKKLFLFGLLASMFLTSCSTEEAEVMPESSETTFILKGIDTNPAPAEGSTVEAVVIGVQGTVTIYIDCTKSTGSVASFWGYGHSKDGRLWKWKQYLTIVNGEIKQVTTAEVVTSIDC